MPLLSNLFEGLNVTPEGAVVPDTPSGNPQELPALSVQAQFALLLQNTHIELNPQEALKVKLYQEARIVLGAAGAASMICEETCPFLKTCPLAQIKKAPFGETCPFEAHYVTTRFSSWMHEMKRSPENLIESERVTISNLVYLDLQEQRCVSELAKAKNALLAQRSVRDIDAQTGAPICWEDVVHISQQNLDQITLRRRMIMKDFELTPEQKTKKKKAEGPLASGDLSSRQAENRDRLASARRQLTIEAKSEPVVEPVPI